MSVELLADANDGNSAGAVFIPSSICGINQSRADSRTAYLDTVIDRPNLHVAVEQTATRLILRNGTVDHARLQLTRAQGVEVCDIQLLLPLLVNTNKSLVRQLSQCDAM
jgi:choline dehydrogenase-like flavoprotein